MKTELVKVDMIVAMKSKDKKKKEELSYLLNALQMEAKNKLNVLTEDEENQVIMKLVKQTKDAMEISKSRPDAVEGYKYTLSVYEKYAPQMMSETEIRHEVYSVCAELNIDINDLTSKDKGKIMGRLMKRVRGKADGQLVNKVIN